MCVEIVFQNLFHTKSCIYHIWSSVRSGRWAVCGFWEEAVVSSCLWGPWAWHRFSSLQAQKLWRNSKEKVMGQKLKDKLPNGRTLIGAICWISVYRIKGGRVHAWAFSYYSPKLSTWQIWTHGHWGAGRYVGPSCSQGWVAATIHCCVNFQSCPQFKEKRQQSPSRHWLLCWIKQDQNPDLS